MAALNTPREKVQSSLVHPRSRRHALAISAIARHGPSFSATRVAGFWPRVRCQVKTRAMALATDHGPARRGQGRVRATRKLWRFASARSAHGSTVCQPSSSGVKSSGHGQRRSRSLRPARFARTRSRKNIVARLFDIHGKKRDIAESADLARGGNGRVFAACRTG